MTRLALFALAVLLAGCGGTDGLTAPDDRQPALVLISIDGFRHDYLGREDAQIPVLRRWAAEGVRAEELVPVYPSKTFPNHYSLVTGLHPETHGIVGNTMRDPTMGDARGDTARFSLGNRSAVTDSRWWGGEPIWVTAEKQGLRTGTVSWPGSEAEILGVRPTRWLEYDGAMTYEARVDSALGWLAEGARFVTLYFEAVDSAGHRHGPDAPQTARAMERVDAALARLAEGLAALGAAQTTDLVIVSDHGMTPVRQPVYIEDVVDLDRETVDVIWGEAGGIWPAPGANVDSLVARVDAMDHVAAHRRENVPRRFHHRASPRIPPVVIIPEPGWTVTSRGYVESRGLPSGGAHGYDNEHPDMHGLFVAYGPSFRQREETGALSAVDVYGILADALGLQPAPHDGSAEAAARVLR